MSEAKKEVPEGLVRRKGGPPVQAEGADAPAPAADAPAKDEQDDIIEYVKQRGPVVNSKGKQLAPDRLTLLEKFMFFLCFTAFVSIVYVALRFLAVEESPSKRLMWPEELQRYAGGPRSSSYLAILGEVFDVTEGEQFYGQDEGSYSFFVGKDASRAYITGDFKGDLHDDVSDFTPEQCAGLIRWRDFYRNHTTYKFKGRLIGRFYTQHGQPRPALHKVERLAREAKTTEEKMREQEAQWPSCNMRWSERAGGYVWCDNGMHPRKLFTQLPGGKPTTRCACFKEIGWSDVRQVYPGCSPEASECQTQKPKAG